MKTTHFTVKVAKTRAEMGKTAADDAAALLQALLTEKEYVNAVFAAAPSQNEMLAALSVHTEIDFTRINALHMDEYIGLQKNAPQSFGEYLKAHIFDLVPFHEVHYIHGWEDDIQKECARYTELYRNYRPDVVFMGIGENGHIAFNDPGVADFRDTAIIKPVALDEVCRMQQVHDGCFPDINAVPRQALTLTIPALMNVPHHICVVPGKAKAKAVRDSILGPVSEAVPASILRLSPDATMYLDADSSSLLSEE